MIKVFSKDLKTRALFYSRSSSTAWGGTPTDALIGSANVFMYQMKSNEQKRELNTEYSVVHRIIMPRAVGFLPSRKDYVVIDNTEYNILNVYYPMHGDFISIDAEYKE